MNNIGTFTSVLSEVSAGCAKKGTCFDRQMAAGACGALATARQTKGVSSARSPLPSATHVNVQCAPCMKSKELLYGRILGPRTAV